MGLREGFSPEELPRVVPYVDDIVVRKPLDPEELPWREHSHAYIHYPVFLAVDRDEAIAALRAVETALSSWQMQQSAASS